MFKWIILDDSYEFFTVFIELYMLVCIFLQIIYTFPAIVV